MLPYALVTEPIHIYIECIDFKNPFVTQNRSPYPIYDAHDHKTLDELQAAFKHLQPGEKLAEETVTTVGRISTRRDGGKNLFFLDLQQDGHSYQAVVNRKNMTRADDFNLFWDLLGRGDVVKVDGVPGRSPKGELSVYAASIEVLSPCLHHLPLSGTLKDTGIRFRQRYLDMMVNPQTIQSIKVRSKMLRYLRDYLDRHRFIEVETPILNDVAGGANARPFITEADSGANKQPYKLRIAPELYLKQLVIGGLDRVYEIGKVFRNEGVDSTHQPEFTTLEFYEAYGDFETLISRTQDIISGLVENITGTLRPNLTLHASQSQLEDDVKQEINFGKPYNRIEVMSELQKHLGPIDLDSPDLLERLMNFCEEHGIQSHLTSTRSHATEANLIDKLIGHFIEPQCVNPTFIIYHPKIQSPLAKERPEEPNTCYRFELFVRGQEICNAYVELNNPVEQRQRFKAQEKDFNFGDSEAQLPDEGFCTALEYGLPPTTGWGMGLDRMLMLLTNNTQIREVQTFPQMKEDKLLWEMPTHSIAKDEKNNNADDWASRTAQPPPGDQHGHQYHTQHQHHLRHTTERHDFNPIV
ncbi:lysyl-tRNA synthetase [Sphaeroforma arctica JP610]|uniref:Lysine--tRNA ligase n=1 Tax=Sphaeroforma arctica JP610 TaxID=667725 RepID=A0A0L0G023_9EUKA|nr:lysyl-tRNA synthetase [Sphaeroforma arctica JP610]KNC82194.1 lysyl-tRNA synthetase [Sphaeroforma arctica JP610]|eukprot:XP_014156096.1 lysyl-tRNA synthetase [Sphaeroforma arctica JP610]